MKFNIFAATHENLIAESMNRIDGDYDNGEYVEGSELLAFSEALSMSDMAGYVIKSSLNEMHQRTTAFAESKGYVYAEAKSANEISKEVWHFIAESAIGDFFKRIIQWFKGIFQKIAAWFMGLLGKMRNKEKAMRQIQSDAKTITDKKANIKADAKITGLDIDYDKVFEALGKMVKVDTYTKTDIAGTVTVDGVFGKLTNIANRGSSATAGNMLNSPKELDLLKTDLTALTSKSFTENNKKNQDKMLATVYNSTTQIVDAFSKAVKVDALPEDFAKFINESLFDDKADRVMTGTKVIALAKTLNDKISDLTLFTNNISKSKETFNQLAKDYDKTLSTFETRVNKDKDDTSNSNQQSDAQVLQTTFTQLTNFGSLFNTAILRGYAIADAMSSRWIQEVGIVLKNGVKAADKK